MKKEGKEKTQTNRILKEVGLQLEGKQEKHPWPGLEGSGRKESSTSCGRGLLAHLDCAQSTGASECSGILYSPVNT